MATDFFYQKPKSYESAILDIHLMLTKMAYYEDLHRNRFDLKFKLVTFKCIREIAKTGSLCEATMAELEKEMKYYEDYYKQPSNITVVKKGDGSIMHGG